MSKALKLEEALRITISELIQLQELQLIGRQIQLA